MGSGTADEFPLLSALGLYAAEIRGDGNCLFNALSDQIYGHQNGHATIRARVIEHMRARASHYKQFIDVHPGGGIRRNPKRKTAGGYSSPSTSSSTPGRRKTGGKATQWKAASTTEIDRVFERHLQSMAQGGTWGDHLEISAFAEAYGCDVKIYQRDFAYIVAPSAVTPDAVPAAITEPEKPTRHDATTTEAHATEQQEQREIPASDDEPELDQQLKEPVESRESQGQNEEQSTEPPKTEVPVTESSDDKHASAEADLSVAPSSVTAAELAQQQQPPPPSAVVEDAERQTGKSTSGTEQVTSTPRQRPTAHIAYHSWEHYSSIRNLAGPHLGPPNVTARVLSPAEEQEQRQQLAHNPYTVLPWQVDVVSKSLPFLSDKNSITQALITAKGDINSAVCALLDRDDGERDEGTSIGSSSHASWQESSSVERDPDSDDEDEDHGFGGGPKKRQDRRRSRGGYSASSGIARSDSGKLRIRRSADARHALSKLASFSDASASQESLISTVAAPGAGGWESETSSYLDGPSHGSAGSSTNPSSIDESPAECIAVADRKAHDTADLSHTTIFSAGGTAAAATAGPASQSPRPGGSPTKHGRAPVRLKLLGPRPPAPPDSSAAGPGPRISARDRRDIKKLAQKAARKERHMQESQQQQQQQQQHAQAQPTSTPPVALRSHDGAGEDVGGPVGTPPVVVDTLRTLYI